MALLFSLSLGKVYYAPTARNTPIENTHRIEYFAPLSVFRATVLCALKLKLYVEGRT
jgi:hypothetical protein